MTNNHKLGVYLAPHHDPQAWREYLVAMNPPWVRILMPGDAPTDLVSEVYRLCPNAELSLRWWDLDDGGDGNKWSKFIDPEASALRDATEMRNRYERMEAEASKNGLPFPRREHVFFNTPNEPPIQEVELREAIAVNAAEMCRLFSLYGFGSMALEISVGNPHEWPPHWDWAQPVFDRLDRLNGVLAIHEYWQPEGPHYVWTDDKGKERKDWGALAGRYGHIPFQGGIVITETGVDGRIYERHATPDTGYLKFMDQWKYAEQMEEYLVEIKKDERIEAALPFITDVADKEWESFNTVYAKDAFVAMLERIGGEGEPDETDTVPVTVHLPSVHGGGSSDEPDSSEDSGVVEPVHVQLNPGAIDPKVARAIMLIESGGSGYNADGSLKIRFEAHIFEQYISKNIFDAHFRYVPGEYNSQYYRESIRDPWIAIHVSQANERSAVAIAQNINQEAAAKATSFGVAQVMGFNHARVGYDSALQMAKAYSRDVIYQYFGFMNYILTDPELLQAVREKDWKRIALLYNGSGQVEYYANLLKKKYEEIQGDY